jgi:hypothetical protein
MNTKHTFKSKEESVSLNFQDSNLKVNKDTDNLDTAFMIEGCKTDHKEVCEEKTNNSTKETRLSSPLILPNNTGLGHPRKTHVNPIVETNLKAGDLDFLSTEMGDEIARIVVNEILSSQSLKYGAITRKPADNFI